MKSPFPGMDPYIEARGLWEDFHDRLVTAIADTIGQLLPDRYVARLGERAYIVLEPSRDEPEREQRSKGDIAVTLAPGHSIGSDAAVATVEAAVTDASVEMTAIIETEFRETFVEIRELNADRRLVTTIEVLSPSNKRYESYGWSLYLLKRQSHLHGHANLIEIDLLRGGRRMPMEENWPDSPYYILVGRKQTVPRCRVWPAHFRHPLPRISVPLLSPDPDVDLILQPLVDAIYSRSRYRRDIEYTKPCRPALSEADDQWLQARLQEVSTSG